MYEQTRFIPEGTTKVKEFIGGAVPGFAEHYEKLQRN